MNTKPPANIEAEIGYHRVRKTIILDKNLFKPCEVKTIETGYVHKTIYLIHYNGEKWDIVRIKENNIERYII